MNNTNSNPTDEKVAIIGAGISGLSCGMLLSEFNTNFKVFESSEHIGGLARSFKWHGINCDLAPHRLFTKNEEILNELLELVPMEMKKRQSKMFIRGKIIRDPVNPFELLYKFNPLITFKLVFGFIFKRKYPETTFENLALNAFGRGLYEFFFKPYTEKLLGEKPENISMEWGRQKIRVSGLGDVFKRNTKIFFKGFYYPKKGGYGAIANTLYNKINDHVLLKTSVIGFEMDNKKITGVKYIENGQEKLYKCDRVISTIPSTILGKMLGKDFSFKYQPVKIVYLMVKKKNVTPYHWIYFGDKDVVINRLAEFKNFSDHDTPDDKSVLCAEVTCPTTDPVNDVLKAVYKYKLFKPEELGDTLLIDEKFGYPVYLKDFEQVKSKLNNEIGKIKNLHLVGRNAEFRHIDVDEGYASARSFIQKLKSKAGHKTITAKLNNNEDVLDNIITDNETIKNIV